MTARGESRSDHLNRVERCFNDTSERVNWGEEGKGETGIRNDVDWGKKEVKLTTEWLAVRHPRLKTSLWLVWLGLMHVIFVSALRLTPHRALIAGLTTECGNSSKRGLLLY